MFKVNLVFHEEHLILRAGPAELLILAEHVAELRQLTATHEFAAYFRDQALVNRSARKLFDAWVAQRIWVVATHLSGDTRQMMYAISH